MLEISVRDVSELKAVVIAFSRLENNVRTEINQATRTHANPIWTGEVSRNVRTPMDQKMLAASARVKAGNPPVLQAAQSTRAIGGRLRPAENWQGWEFGTDRNKVSTYNRKSKNGGTHKVVRHASRHMPSATRNGRVIYPAAANSIPRFASLWVQTVVRIVHEASEGKG